MMESFFLGITGGLSCLAYCAPVLLPYLITESGGMKKSIIYTAEFLTGRLAGYMIFAVISFFIGKIIIAEQNPVLLGLIYIFTSLSFFIYLLFNNKKVCISIYKYKKKFSSIDGNYFIIFLGFITGINLCPTFLFVMADNLKNTDIIQNLLSFFMFFLGTSLYFLPFPFTGLFKNKPEVKQIGNFVMVIIALYYIMKGLQLIFL